MSKNTYTSLTSGLLARKGEAVPATTSFNGENIVSAHPSKRPLNSTSIPPTPSAWANSGNILSQESEQDPHSNSHPHPQKEIPVEEPPRAPRVNNGYAEEPLPSAGSHAGNAQGSEDCESYVPLAAGENGTSRRSSVTFRLDATRYLCLKMASAKLGRTHQDILTAALDMYLQSLADDALSDCSCLQQLIKGDNHVNPS